MEPKDYSHPGTGDEPLTPEEMLALADDQRRSVEQQQSAFVPIIVLGWAVAWLIGFLALWLIDGMRPAFALPIAVAAPLFVALLVGAVILSTVLGTRAGRGFRGRGTSAFTGGVYGQTWWIGSLGIVVFGQAMAANGMGFELARFFYPSAFVIFAGVMYLVASAIWQAIPMMILGMWAVAVGAIAPFFGYPTHYLVFALAGGGGFLLTGVWSLIQSRRTRRRVQERSRNA